MKHIKSIQKSVVFFVVFCLFFSNCSTSLTVQKRLYRKGFNVNVSKTKKEKEKQDKNTISSSRAKREILLPNNKNILPENKIILPETSEQINAPSGQNSKKTILNHESTQKAEKENTSKKSGSSLTNQVIEQKTNVKPNQKNNTLLYTLLFAGVLSFAAALKFVRSKKAYRISAWAKNNKNKARTTIALSSTAVTAIGLGLGYLLNSEGISLSKQLVYTASVVAAFTTIIYPFKSNKNNFIKRKALEIIFLAGILLGTVYIGNQQTNIEHQTRKIEKVGSINHHIGNEANTGLILLKVLLVLVLTTAFFGLAALLVSMCCSIACLGLIPVGILFLFGLGTPLIVGYVFAIRYVLRYLGKSKEEKAELRTEKRKIIPLILSTSSAVIAGITGCIWFSYLISLISLSSLLLNCILLAGILLALTLLIIAIRYW